jgi:hypothetical protein
LRQVRGGSPSHSSLEGDFYFVPPPLVAAASSAQSTVTLEGVFWDSIKTSRDPADFKAYLVQFPKGVFAELAQNRLAALQQETSSDSKPATSSAKAAQTTSQAANALQATQSPVAAPPMPPPEPGSLLLLVPIRRGKIVRSQVCLPERAPSLQTATSRQRDWSFAARTNTATREPR